MLRLMIPSASRFPMLTGWEREFPAMLERFFGPEEWLPLGEEFHPRANVTETPEGLEVTVELPGMKAEEFKVEVHNGELWISGEKKEEKEEQGKTYHRVERRFGEFKRVIPLATNLNKEKVTAEYKEGVLRIAIPKTEVAKPKHIEVTAA